MAEMIARPGQTDANGRQKMRPWRELAFFASVFMEMSWVALWSRVLLRGGPKSRYAGIFAVLGVMLLLAYAIGRTGERLSLRMPVRRAGMGLWVVVCLLVGPQLLLENTGGWTLAELLARPLRTFADMANIIPLEFVVMMLVLVTLWRGVSLVGRYIEPVVVISGFRTGVVMFFAHGLLVPLSDSIPLAALDIFLFASLLAIDAARIAVLSQLRGGQAIPFDRQWLGGITLAVVCMVGLAAAVAGVIRGDGFVLLSRLVAGIIYVLALLLSPLVWLFMRALLWIADLLRFGVLLQALLDIMRSVQALIDALIDAIAGWMQRTNVAGLQKYLSYLALSRPVLLWGTILFFVVLVLLTVRKHIWRPENEPDQQEIESLLQQKSLLDLLREALRRGLGRMRDELDKLAGLRQARRLLAAARIRRIYAHLMDLSSRLNSPRPASRTPLEFLPSLEEVFPALSNELETITHAYLRVRYGDLPETGAEVEAVEHAWRRVAQNGQEQLKSQRKSAAAGPFVR